MNRCIYILRGVLHHVDHAGHGLGVWRHGGPLHGHCRRVPDLSQVHDNDARAHQCYTVDHLAAHGHVRGHLLGAVAGHVRHLAVAARDRGGRGVHRVVAVRRRQDVRQHQGDERHGAVHQLAHLVEVHMPAGAHNHCRV